MFNIMRKVSAILGLMLILLICSNYAYCANPKKEKGFEINLGISNSLNLHYGFIYYGLADVSMGYRINHHLYVGVGFALNHFDMTARFYQKDVVKEHYHYNVGWVEELEPIWPDMNERFLLPIYVTFRCTFTKTNVSPLVRIDTGYQFGSNYFQGFFGDINMGFDFRNNQRFGIYLCLGVRVEQNSYDIMNWKKQKQSPFVRFPDIKFGFRF